MALLIMVATLLLVLQPGYGSYLYWSNSSVELTSLFKIDTVNKRIVLAAKNSICHLSLDLQSTSNFKDATPSDGKRSYCLNTIFQSSTRCQNFHHILHFPTPTHTAQLQLPNNITVPLNETVIVCGSDAYQPLCFYRNRTNLDIITSYTGSNVCPFDKASISTSYLSSSGQLISGTSLNVHADRYGVTFTPSPYNGSISVRTIDNGFVLFKEPEFVRIFERGDYYYFFMRETAAEISSPSPVYSRVGRICKNDTGTTDVTMPSNPPVLTTYLKARILCSSTIKSNDDFPYVFNDLYDVVHITNGTIDSTVNGEYMYAVFTSPLNAPAGSAICVYSFDGRHSNDLSSVFTQSYYRPTGTNTWTIQTNSKPIMCNGTARSYSEAAENVLMYPPIDQVGSALVQDDGFLYKKLLVDQVFGVNGVKYDVFLIAASTNTGNLYFLKKTYVSSRHGNKVVTSQSVSLERGTNNGAGQTVGNIELYKEDNNVSVYISTSEGLYKVSLTDCNTMYTSCGTCISSRDPYCAYNTNSLQCEPLAHNGGPYLQDIVHGNASICSSLSSSSSLVPSTTTATTTATTSELIMTTTNTVIDSNILTTTLTPTIKRTPVITTTSSKLSFNTKSDTLYTTTTTPTRNSSLPTLSTAPTVGGVSTSLVEEHIWTIVAGCGGLTVGVVIGCILLALVRNKNRFRWGKFLSRRQRYDFDEEKAPNTYELPPSKLSDFKNNSVEYSKVPQRASTPPLSKLNPSNGAPPNKITDSPILTKYTNTGSSVRRHNRSMSFGSSVPHFLPTNGSSTPASSPMDPNLKNTFHVEEPIPNTQIQRYGHNVIGRQMSKEYPIIPGLHSTTGFHMKTNSLDLDYDLYK